MHPMQQQPHRSAARTSGCRLRLMRALRLAEEGTGGTAGSSLIEFALTLPVLLLVVFGITSFGMAMNNYIVLTQATGIGARAVAVSRQQTLNPCQVASTAVSNAASGLNTADLTFNYSFNGVAYTGTTCASSSQTSGAAGNLQQGKAAVISVSYPCKLSSYKYNFGACSLTASTTEVVQ
jgi:Flp pilus assembly protein TadG